MVCLWRRTLLAAIANRLRLDLWLAGRPIPLRTSPVTLLTSLIVLAGCAGPGQLFLQNPIPIDHLDGNYQRLASCTYEQLARRPGRWRLIDLDEQHTVRIVHTNGTQAQWELSFVNEEGGRQTRLEATSVNGSFPSEHELALARACAA
jgi:hypothetical protein